MATWSKGKIESYFSTVVHAKRLPLKSLEKYENDLLIITEDEEEIGVKYVFQTRVTKDTVTEKMRGPRLMWSRNETFIDNNAQFLLNHLNKFYS